MQINVVPSKPQKISETNTEGLYEITGLYPGYGYTLGNALRRMLLSSIPGSTITSVRVKGVPHEFSTIEGMKEDVLIMVLNMKKIRFSIDTGETSQTIKLKKKGKGKIHASDFDIPSQVSIANKDSYLCELTADSAELDIEAVVEKGIGFRSREDDKEKKQVGVILLDAAFSPVKRSYYEIEDMRVGNRTDFNRLKIFLETDGTIKPEEALKKAIQTMITQLEAMVGFQKSDDKEEIKQAEKDTKKLKLEELDISASTKNTLIKNGIESVEDLVKKGKDDVAAIKGIGEKAVSEITNALAEQGIKF